MGFPLLLRWHLYIESVSWIPNEFPCMLSHVGCHLLPNIDICSWCLPRLLTPTHSYWLIDNQANRKSGVEVAKPHDDVMWVTQSFDAFFDLRLNKRLSIQSWGWWFETPSCPLWRHPNEFDTLVNSNDHPISTIGFPIPVKQHLYIE